MNTLQIGNYTFTWEFYDYDEFGRPRAHVLCNGHDLIQHFPVEKDLETAVIEYCTVLAESDFGNNGP